MEVRDMYKRKGSVKNEELTESGRGSNLKNSLLFLNQDYFRLSPLN